MRKKLKAQIHRDPAARMMARVIRLPAFKVRVVPNKKLYSRKAKASK